MPKKFNRAWVVCGPESSGSVFVARTISYAAGKCSSPGEYSGYGYNNGEPCENYVLHRSIPYQRPKKFADALEQEVVAFSGLYDKVNYILTTRDKNVSILSKMRRFGDSREESESDYLKAKDFFLSLARDPDVFIWNYESMVLLGDAYFERLYDFFGIESDYFPDVYDGNLAYINQTVNSFSLRRIRRRLKSLFRK